MVVSIHAVQFNHIRHHKYCLTENDYEGKSAAMSWYGAIIYGPVHMFLIHRVTLQLGNKNYVKNVIAELISAAIFLLIVFYFNINFLVYHIIVMIIGEFLMAFLQSGQCITIPMKALSLRESSVKDGKIKSLLVCSIIWSITCSRLCLL